MFEIITFILVCYGLSNAVVFTDGPFYIFEKFRELMKKMPSNLEHGVNCMICFPFQVGIILSLLNSLIYKDVIFTPSQMLAFTDDYFILGMLIDGSIASGTSWFLNVISEHYEKNETDE